MTFHRSGTILFISSEFLHHELSNCFNFHSFFWYWSSNESNLDTTLWPLVLIITLLFSFSHQIVVINTIILFLIFPISSVCAGFALCQFSNETQVGAGIVYIFSFLLKFMVYNIINSNSMTKQLILRFAICCTIIVYSHLLSVVALAIIIGNNLHV